MKNTHIFVNWLIDNKKELLPLINTKQTLLKETDSTFHEIIESDFKNAIKETITLKLTKDLNLNPEEAIIIAEELMNDKQITDYLGV